MSEELKLFVQYKPPVAEQQEALHTCLAGADGLVVAPGSCRPEQRRVIPVGDTLLIDGDPEQERDWLEDDSCLWVCTRGLAETARMRDEWPELIWVPQLTVYKPAISYRFSGPAIGEGFSFYIPDSASIKGWQVTDGDVSLVEAVTRAIDLGFDTLWLDSREAEVRGKGLALEMLEKISDCPLAIWISGGAKEVAHLRNLACVDGAAAVVIDQQLAREAGMDLLRQALTAPTAFQEVAVPEVMGVPVGEA